MIYYDHLPLSSDILDALAELEIDYVFQPIFYKDGETVYAREALMRPKHKPVTELIQEYMETEKLHILEVATLFGAAQAFILRGYNEKISINTFPNECITDDELQVFTDYFGADSVCIILEMLEYPSFSREKWISKQRYRHTYNAEISIDDYGTGINDISKVELLNPDIVKLDRSLISDIDKDGYKQANCEDIINLLHSMGKIVVAEGIERKEEFDFLVNLGADLFQGYYLARPV